MTDTASKRPSALLSRVPWKLPVASKAEGIYIDLQDGKRLIDAVGMVVPIYCFDCNPDFRLAGGAAVACIGNGHPVVKQAIMDQVDKLSCELA